MIGQDLQTYFPLLAVLTFFTLIAPSLDKSSIVTRRILSIIVLIIFIRYIDWRFFHTVLPYHYVSFQGFWIWFCFSLEMISWFENGIFHVLITKTRNNSPMADVLEKQLRILPKSELPTVDIFIPTYNEEIDVLEKAIIGAENIDWPQDKITLWILDDGRRPWLRQYCRERKIGYIARNDNTHAKAGNINFALKHTTSEYIAIFDADFVPQKNFLYRTMGFFEDPKIAIVQTPQFFYNFDFLQTNLGVFHQVMDDQRLFFDVIMPSRDAWDSAFFCGSCAVFKREPVVSVGGIPHESVTEDILLSIHLLKKGYITRYLNEPLSHGLAAESIHAFTVQRKRWCKGGIQLLFAKNGIFSSSLALKHRLFFLPLHWLIHPFIRLLVILIPIIFLWTNTLPMLIGHPSEILDYQAPVFLTSYLLMLWHGPRRWIPVITTAFENIMAINLLPTILNTLTSPYQRVFKITPKGKTVHRHTYHPLSLSVSIFFFAALAGGLILNIMTPYRVVSHIGLFPVAAAWAFFTLIITGFMITLSIERPRYRSEERFDVSLPVKIKLKDFSLDGTIKNFSPHGMLLHCLNFPPHMEEHILSLHVEDLGNLTGKVISSHENYIKISLLYEQTEEDENLRRKVIAFLYTGPHIVRKHPETYLWHFIKQLFHRFFGNHDHLKKFRDQQQSPSQKH